MDDSILGKCCVCSAFVHSDVEHYPKVESLETLKLSTTSTVAMSTIGVIATSQYVGQAVW